MYENGGFWKRVTSRCGIPVNVHASIKDGSFFQSGRFKPCGQAKTDTVFLATEKKIVIFQKKKNRYVWTGDETRDKMVST